MDQLQIHYVDLGVPRVADLKSELSVGRTEGNDLVLNHPSVSRKHARFEPRDSGWWIIDLKSTNGVKINGNLVTEAQVNAGDKVLIGSVQLELKSLPSVNFTGDSMFDNPSGMESPVKLTEGRDFSSSWTEPMRTLSPALTCASVTRFPLILTPLVDLRSMIHQPLSRGSKRACLRETEGWLRTRSFPSVRPTDSSLLRSATRGTPRST